MKRSGHQNITIFAVLHCQTRKFLWFIYCTNTFIKNGLNAGWLCIDILQNRQISMSDGQCVKKFCLTKLILCDIA